MNRSGTILHAPEGGRVTPFDTPANAPLQYGHLSPSPKNYRIDLATARDGIEIKMGGSFFWIYNGSGVDAEADIQFNNERSDAFTCKWGFAIEGLKFNGIFVTNSAQAGAYLDIMVCDLPLGSLNPINTASTTTISGTVAVDIQDTDVQVNQAADNLVTVADVTVTAAAAAASILAANAKRYSAIITSLSSNTQEVRLGDSNTGAARGIPILPGESVNIDTTAAIYAYTAAGDNQTLSVVYTDIP